MGDQRLVNDGQSICSAPAHCMESECVRTFSHFQICVARAKGDNAGGAEHKTNTKRVICISENVVGFWKWKGTSDSREEEAARRMKSQSSCKCSSACWAARWMVASFGNLVRSDGNTIVCTVPTLLSPLDHILVQMEARFQYQISTPFLKTPCQSTSITPTGKASNGN